MFECSAVWSLDTLDNILHFKFAMKLHAALIVLICFLLSPAAIAGPTCQQLFESERVSFQNDTKLSVVASPRALRWFAQNHASVLIRQVLQEKTFLSVLANQLRLPDLEVSDLEFSVHEGAESGVDLRVQMNLSGRHFEFRAFAFVDPERGPQLRVQDFKSNPSFNGWQRMTAPIFLNAFQAQLDSLIAANAGKLPFQLTNVEAIENGLQLGFGARSLIRDKIQKCEMTCSDYDLAIVLNRNSLQEIVSQILLRHDVSPLLRSVETDFVLLGVPQIGILKSNFADELAVTVTLRLKPKSAHPIYQVVKPGFTFQLSLELRLALDPTLQTLTAKLDSIRPEGLSFSESDIRAPFQLLARLAPSKIKDTIHRELVHRVTREIRSRLEPIYLAQLNLPGLRSLPPMEIVALGADHSERHPYIAMRLLQKPQ